MIKNKFCLPKRFEKTQKLIKRSSKDPEVKRCEQNTLKKDSRNKYIVLTLMAYIVDAGRSPAN